MRAFGQHYPVGPVTFFLRLVLVGSTSLRAASRLFSLIGASLHLDLGEPDWTTGRWWLMRIGLAKLLEAKERADDWVLLMDHSAQIGREKCLLILGLRASEMPPPGTCLGHEDVRPICLRVLEDPDKHMVQEELAAVAKEIGAPRAIVNDFGADIHGGVKLFQEQHPQTIEIYDITHKCACLLKHRLEKDERWSTFTRQVGQTKIALLQTELACLIPPHQRTKARYMNLETLLAWGKKTLGVLEQPPAELLATTTRERLEQKLGWLPAYREALVEWSEWQTVVTSTESLLRRMGLSTTTPQDVAKELRPLVNHASTRVLARELKAFAVSQAAPLRPGERLPASTEVLESCFGKLKVLEKDQARNGLTGMVLSLGAMVWKFSADTVHQALEKVSVRGVKEWIAKNIGTTVQAQRRLVYKPQAACETKMG